MLAVMLSAGAGGVTYSRGERVFAGKIRTTLAPPLPALGSEAQVVSTRGDLSSASADMGDVSKPALDYRK